MNILCDTISSQAKENAGYLSGLSSIIKLATSNRICRYAFWLKQSLMLTAVRMFMIIRK